MIGSLLVTKLSHARLEAIFCGDLRYVMNRSTSCAEAAPLQLTLPCVTVLRAHIAHPLEVVLVMIERRIELVRELRVPSVAPQRLRRHGSHGVCEILILP